MRALPTIVTAAVTSIVMLGAGIFVGGHIATDRAEGACGQALSAAERSMAASGESTLAMLAGQYGEAGEHAARAYTLTDEYLSIQGECRDALTWP